MPIKCFDTLEICYYVVLTVIEFVVDRHIYVLLKVWRF